MRTTESSGETEKVITVIKMTLSVTLVQLKIMNIAEAYKTKRSRNNAITLYTSGSRFSNLNPLKGHIIMVILVII